MNMTDELILQSWMRTEDRGYQLQPLDNIPNELGDTLLNVRPGGKWLWSQSEALTKKLNEAYDNHKGLDLLHKVFHFRWTTKLDTTNSGSVVAWQRFMAYSDSITVSGAGPTLNALLQLGFWYYQTPVVKAAGLLSAERYDLYCNPIHRLMEEYLDKEENDELYAAAETEAEIMVEELRKTGRLK